MGKHSVSPEDWYQRDHESIYNIAQGFDSGKVTAVSQALTAVADRLHSIMDSTGIKVQGIIESDWRGETAETAREGFSGLFRRANTAVETTREIANALPAVGHAMDAAKAAIEPPVKESTAVAVAGTNSGLLAAANMARIGEQQHARYQMTSLFSQPAVDTSGRVEDVSNLSQLGGNQQANYTNNSSNIADVGTKSLGQVGGQINDLDRASGKTTAAFDQGAQGSGYGQGQGQPGGGQPGGAPGGQAGAGQGSGSGSGAGLAGGMGSLADRARTRAAANGLDENYFSRNNSILQDPLGRTTDKWGPAPRSGFGQDRLDGAPGAGRPGTIAGTGMPGMGGTRGAGTMGMMPMNGRGGGRDETKDHKIPKELINQDNTDEFIGQLRSASPAVIGELTPEELKFQREQEARHREELRLAKERQAAEAYLTKQRQRGAKFSDPTPDWLKRQ